MYLTYTLVAFIPALIAKSKNYNFAKWWLFSTLFWPITLVMIIFKKKNELYLDDSTLHLSNKWIFIAYVIGLYSYTYLFGTSVKNEATKTTLTNNDNLNQYEKAANTQNSQGLDEAISLNNNDNNDRGYITVGGINKKIIPPIETKNKDNKINLKCIINNTDISIKSTSTSKIYGSSYFHDKANGIFLILNIKITNNANNPIKIDASDFSLLSANNKFFDPKSNLYCNEFFYTKLNPGVIKSGHLIFDIPVNMLKQKLCLLYLPSQDSEDEIGFLPIQ